MPHILTIPIDNPVFMNGDPLYGVAETYPAEEGHPPLWVHSICPTPTGDRSERSTTKSASRS